MPVLVQMAQVGGVDMRVMQTMLWLIRKVAVAAEMRGRQTLIAMHVCIIITPQPVMMIMVMRVQGMVLLMQNTPVNIRIPTCMSM